ncbi:MAG: carboxypeptidase-like regulatory domain-containing protein, partial [Chitinophagaceae bacterium]|nr:carboxypeptidase-like regulatory domain-containing protein [Chitinophagaceae bacterium]
MKIFKPKILLTAFLALLSLASLSQKKPSYVSGYVIDENERPISQVSVNIFGRPTGLTTHDSGYFRLKVQPDKAFAVVFSYTGRQSEQKNFILNEGEEEVVTIRLDRGSNVLQEVIVSDQRDRTEVGLIRPNPKT